MNRVLIGVPTAEFARHAAFYDHFNALEKPTGTIVTFVHGQSPAKNRNIIVEQAILNDCTHILLLDDDVVVKPDALMKLLRNDVDAVSGVYLMRNYPHQPIIFDYADQEGRCRHHYPEDNKNGLVEIVASGLGILLLKVDALKRMEQPWFRLGEIEKDHWCDDIGFFKRARDLGIKSYCDLSVLVGHMATVTITPEYIDGKWTVTYDTNGYSKVMFPSIKPDMELV